MIRGVFELCQTSKMVRFMNIGKYGPEKLRDWTLFMQWRTHDFQSVSEKKIFFVRIVIITY